VEAVKKKKKKKKKKQKKHNPKHKKKKKKEKKEKKKIVSRRTAKTRGRLAVSRTEKDGVPRRRQKGPLKI